MRSDLLASPLLTPRDNNVTTETYNRVLREILDKHAPIETRTITLRPNAPWFSSSEDLRVLKRDRRRFERQYRMSGLEIHRQMYKEKCLAYRDALDQAKANYYSNKIRDSDTNGLFRIIDGLFKVKAISPLPTHDSALDLAESFSSYFNEKILKLRDTLSSRTELTHLLTKEPPCSSSFMKFETVSEKFIRDLVLKSPTKSCSLDPIPTGILKEHVDLLATPITNIINESFSSGVFPDSLKEGVVFPSFKKSCTDWEAFASYRPITNISFLSKLLERAAAIQTKNYLTAEGLLAKWQSAYRQHHSTETALLRVVNDILLSIDARKEVVLVMLDLSSAFDTIDHTLLLERLRNYYGFQDKVLMWFTSYLMGRSQSVVVKQLHSSSKCLAFGVPQGSVLGPLLFSLYFAPLEKVIHNHDLACMMYADDTQLYLTISPNHDPTTSLLKLEQCIKDVINWCSANALVCNPSKTEVVHFCSRFTEAREDIGSISINGTKVIPVSSARNLGVVFDKFLDFSSHINAICKSATFSIRNIGKLRKYLNQADTERLVHAFITSKLDSCNSILFGLPSYQIEKLQRVQNSAARLVTRTKKLEHISPVLYDLHWLTVKNRIIFKILLITFKALHGLAPGYLSDLITPYRPSRSLRSMVANLLILPKCRTKTYGERAFAVAGPTLWNSLPQFMRELTSVNQFKAHLKTYLFDK